MLRDLGLEDVQRTLVMGLPGPVDHWGGMVVRPPIMPGWDGYPVVEAASSLIGGRVLLENDVNLRVLGEARAYPPDRGPVAYVKVGTGIGLGIVSIDGTLLRGADGAAETLVTFSPTRRPSVAIVATSGASKPWPPCGRSHGHWPSQTKVAAP
jgi:predicted NBD/HSP70 family sugar kinase